MKRCRPLLVGFAVVMVGCAGPHPANTASTPATTASATTSTDATNQPTTSRPATVLGDQLRQARQRIEAQYKADPDVAGDCLAPPLELGEPVDLMMFRADAPQAKDLNSQGASVTVRLVDPMSNGRWVDFWQGAGCYGVGPIPPEGAMDIVEPHAVDVPGLDGYKTMPQIQSWNAADGSEIILLVWYSDVSRLSQF